MINRVMGPTEWAMLVLLSIIWGGSFFFYAVALTDLPVFTIVFLRVSFSAASGSGCAPGPWVSCRATGPCCGATSSSWG